MLCSIVKSWRNGVGMTLYVGAVRQQGARSETFCASCIMLFVFSGKVGRVTGRTQSSPESQMNYTYFLPPLAYLAAFLFYAICWKHPTSLMWPFPAWGIRTKELCILSMLVPSLSPAPSLLLSTPFSSICCHTFLLSFTFMTKFARVT